MTECLFCGDSVAIPFNCSLCGNRYCGKHRMPENHSCTNIKAFNTDKFRKLKQQKIEHQRLQRRDSVIFMEEIEQDIKQDEVREHIKQDPDIVSFGPERVDLLIALFLIMFSATFYQLITGLYSFGDVILLTILISPGFIFHELGHKYVAIHFGKAARFLLKKKMALITLIMGLIPFGIAGPGAVTVFDYSSKREMGIFAAAGPLVNLALGIIYTIIFLLFKSILEPYGMLFIYGISITLFLGVFNMIPLGPLDGKKVLDWSAGTWIIIIISLILVWILSNDIIQEAL